MLTLCFSSACDWIRAPVCFINKNISFGGWKVTCCLGSIERIFSDHLETTSPATLDAAGPLTLGTSPPSIAGVGDPKLNQEERDLCLAIAL